MPRKNLYDNSLIGETVIIDSHNGEPGKIAGFNNAKVQVAYNWGWLEVSMKEINVVDKFVIYRRRKDAKVLLEGAE